MRFFIPGPVLPRLPNVIPPESREEVRRICAQFWNQPDIHEQVFCANDPVSVHYVMPNYSGHTYH